MVKHASMVCLLLFFGKITPSPFPVEKQKKKKKAPPPPPFLKSWIRHCNLQSCQTLAMVSDG